MAKKAVTPTTRTATIAGAPVNQLVMGSGNGQLNHTMTAARENCHGSGLLNRGVVLECFTIGYNIIEALVAVGAGIAAGSIALVGFGLDSVIGIILAAASAVIMPAPALLKQQTAKRLNSPALAADAVETWVYSYLSLVLIAGLGLNAAFGWGWADSVAALAMLPLVVHEGWEALEEAREE